MDTADNVMNQPNDAAETEERIQHITFLVDIEEYGVDTLRVQEIIRYILPVKVPNAPEPIQGVINFRGEVIPVVDLRKTFGLSPLQVNQFTVIIIIELEGKTFGMAVDRVLDMIDIPLSKLNDDSESYSNADQKHLKTMVKIDGRLVLILDLNKIITFDPNNIAAEIG